MDRNLTFFLSSSGLFDFDLTFLTEALLFFLLACVITFVFLSPISTQLNRREALIDFKLKKSMFILHFANKRISYSVLLCTLENIEQNRQRQLIGSYTNSIFEKQIKIAQLENLNLLQKLKANLAIKSAFLFSNIVTDINMLVKIFFQKKFLSL